MLHVQQLPIFNSVGSYDYDCPDFEQPFSQANLMTALLEIGSCSSTKRYGVTIGTNA